MMTMNSISDFINYTKSQQEVSLVIAKDTKELDDFVQVLADHDFRQAIDTSELFKRITAPSKVYYVVRDSLPKKIYDFIVQYPTGQIEIFDKEAKKSEIVSPLYKDVSVVILVTKESLSNIQKGGFRLLENVGITYQS